MLLRSVLHKINEENSIVLVVGSGVICDISVVHAKVFCWPSSEDGRGPSNVNDPS